MGHGNETAELCGVKW